MCFRLSALPLAFQSNTASARKSLFTANPTPTYRYTLYSIYTAYVSYHVRLASLVPLVAQLEAQTHACQYALAWWTYLSGSGSYMRAFVMLAICTCNHNDCRQGTILKTCWICDDCEWVLSEPSGLISTGRDGVRVRAQCWFGSALGSTDTLTTHSFRPIDPIFFFSSVYISPPPLFIAIATNRNWSIKVAQNCFHFFPAEYLGTFSY